MNDQVNVSIVTRHSGSVPVIRELLGKKFSNFEVVEVIPHLNDISEIRGDVLVGILPINIAAAVQAAGIRFVEFAIDMTPQLRGKELDEQTVRGLNPRLTEFSVKQVGKTVTL